MTMDSSIYLAMILAGLGLSAIYSGMEIGLYTLNRVRLTVLAGRGEPRAVRLRRLQLNSNRTLSTLLVGNNIANYLSTFGLAALLDRTNLSPALAVAINAGVLIPLLFIFGETLPKDLFRTHADHWSYRTSGFLLLSHRFFMVTGLTPLVLGFGRLASRLFGIRGEIRTSARQRISRLITEGVRAGVLSETQVTLADRALALRDRTVGMEMVPYSRVAFISADTETALRNEMVRRRNFTRLPVVAAGGTVIGVMSSLDVLLDPQRSTHDLTEPITEFAPDVKVHEALHTLRRRRQTMAIVTDPRTKRPLGLVTLKDLVEPLTGELAAW